MGIVGKQIILKKRSPQRRRKRRSGKKSVGIRKQKSEECAWERDLKGCPPAQAY